MNMNNKSSTYQETLASTKSSPYQTHTEEDATQQQSSNNINAIKDADYESNPSQGDLGNEASSSRKDEKKAHHPHQDGSAPFPPTSGPGQTPIAAPAPAPAETAATSPPNIESAPSRSPEDEEEEEAVEEADEQALFSVFSKKTRMFILAMTVFGIVFSPFSSFIYLPAITPIAGEYGRSVAEINLTVTLYQVMQALAPLLFGDLSDQIGRRPVYAITFVIYSAANIGLALQSSYGALLVLRALQSTGSSATVSIGNAVMGDMTTSAERGAYMAAIQGTIQVAPALAPVLGGVLIQYLGWRSVFWFLLIASGVFLALYLPLVPETARKVVGNGSIPPPRLNKSLLSVWQHRKREQARENHNDPEGGRTTAAPQTSATASAQEKNNKKKSKRRFKIPIPNIWAAVRIAFEKDVGPLLMFMSLLVMANFAMLIPLQDVIRHQYGFNDLEVGLCYVPFSVGSVTGSVIIGKLQNWNYARVAKSIGVSPDRKRGDDLRRFPIEKARLDLMWPWVGLAVITMSIWGWVVTAGASLAAPLVVLYFAGLSIAGPIAIVSTILVDLYPMNPGRVSSCFNLTRGAFSAAGTAVVQYIIDAWGYGYTYLFMGMLVLASSPVIFVVRKWGPKWREERYVRLHGI